MSSLGVGGVPGSDPGPEGCFLGGSCSDPALNLLLVLKGGKKEGRACLTLPCWAPELLLGAAFWGGVLRRAGPPEGTEAPSPLPSGGSGGASALPQEACPGHSGSQRPAFALEFNKMPVFPGLPI